MSSRLRKRMQLLQSAGHPSRYTGEEKLDSTLVKMERNQTAPAKSRFLASIGAGAIRFMRAGFPDAGTAVYISGKGFLTAQSPFADQIIPVTFRDYKVARAVAQSLGGEDIRAPHDSTPLVDAVQYTGPCNVGNKGAAIDLAGLMRSIEDENQSSPAPRP